MEINILKYVNYFLNSLISQSIGSSFYLSQKKYFDLRYMLKTALLADCTSIFDSQKTCVSIYKCMEFEEYVDWKNKSRSEYYYLSQFICNFTPLGDPMVCCSRDAQGISNKSPAASCKDTQQQQTCYKCVN